MRATSHNSVFAIRFAHTDAFSTPQTRKPLYETMQAKKERSIFR